jgi:glucose-6-phosphate isomerase, archaeal
MHHLPFTFDIVLPAGIPTKYDNHITRSLSSMRGQYADQQAYDALLAQEDALLYEVYEMHRPESSGELLHGISIVHPGRVGDEYFMTKGHFHAVLETAEVYYCLAGQG